MTGPRPRSDQEKIALGKLDKRWSDDARAKDRMNKVLAFPVLKSIPEPSFPLLDKGKQTFQFWCEKLLDAGLLTRITVGEIENLALLDDKIQRSLNKGNSPGINELGLRRSHLAKLESLNVDTTFFAAAKNKSTFAQNGFPGRLRTPAEHQAIRTG